MGKSGKTFYLSPDLDIPPPKGFYDPPDARFVPGRLSLGSLLQSVDDTYPMNSIEPPLEAGRVPKTGVRYTLNDLKSGGVGIWGWLPGSNALGGSIKGSGSLDKVLAVTEVVTLSINKPLKEAMDTEVAKSGVQSYLTRTKWKKPIFMITAMKIARGASCTESRQREGQGSMRVPIGAQGAPPVAAVGAGAIASLNEGYAYEDSGSFVLGYQVRKITCTPSGDQVDKPHTPGAVLGDNTEQGLSVPFTTQYEDEWVDDDAEDVVEDGNESPEESSRWIIL